MIVIKKEIINLKNNKNSSIEILIEPASEYIEVLPQQIVYIEILTITADYEDPLIIEYHENMITIYEGRQRHLNIYINKELVYYTDYNY